MNESKRQRQERPTERRREPHFRVEEQPMRRQPQPLDRSLGDSEGVQLRPPSTLPRSSGTARSASPAQRLASPQPSAPRLEVREDPRPPKREAERVRSYALPVDDYRSYRHAGPGYGQAIEPSGANSVWVLALIVVSVAVLWLAWGPETTNTLSRWANSAGLVPVAAEISSGVVPRALDDHSVTGPPSITPQQIDAVLAAYGSPAAGAGQAFYDAGVRYGIDPAYALAFFIHESSAGTAPQWAGHKGNGTTTHNVGNIICAGYPTCYGRFRDYDSWQTGIEDWYRLILVEYIDGRGLKTVAQILPVYAPAFENDVDRYVNAVQDLVNQWRSEAP